VLVSLNWLKNYVDYGLLSPEELGEMITKSGIEVDGISYVAEKSKDVVVGHVISCEQHPNADKLNLCQVDVGDEQLQIICGAPNVAAGQRVAVAKPGAVLPGDFKIKKVKLRGIESNGMICSLQELGIDEAYIPTDIADGIFVFPEDAKIGENVDTLLNLNDAILEFDLTPNRADALSMLGVAYEVAAILDLPINLPDESVETIDEKSTDYVSVKVEDPELAPYYGAFIIKDIEIKPAPLWMRNYLMAAGIRPINNVVDITNYVLLEYGQPLHAFDYDLLGSKEIIVRRAQAEETMVTLDGQERKLTTDQLVITNGKIPVALAGVMGGENTEVNEQTKTVLLEAAYFNASSIRKTVQHTGLRSEASTRFEKGIDPNRVHQAGIRAAQLLQKYAGGKVLSEAAVFDALDRSGKVVNIDTNHINKRLGTEISSEEIGKILTKLRFEFEVTDDQFSVSVPTRRGDITIFEDMLEEVARIYGYDHLPYTLPAGSSRPGALTEQQRLKRSIKNYLQGTGLMEAITYSLTNEADVEKLISPELLTQDLKPVELAMPMSEDHKYLRLSILPELLKTLAYNRARTELNMGYYEIGSVFITDKEVVTKQPAEKPRLAGALTGIWLENKWQQDKKVVDFFVVKGIIEGLFNYLQIPIVFTQSKLADMHPGRCATISSKGEDIGFLGQLHPAIAKKMDLKDTYVFDLDMAFITANFENEPAYHSIPKYPSITRDIAFIVDQNILAGDIKDTIAANGASLVKKVEIFDVYSGENLPEDKKSIAYSLHFQHPDKTLTDKEVEELYQEIILTINGKYGAYVRS
jgi:phenylalanyl-tRNA synthetase beta chain